MLKSALEAYEFHLKNYLVSTWFRPITLELVRMTLYLVAKHKEEFILASFLVERNINDKEANLSFMIEGKATHVTGILEEVEMKEDGKVKWKSRFKDFVQNKKNEQEPPRVGLQLPKRNFEET